MGEGDERSEWAKFILPTFLPARARGSMMVGVGWFVSRIERCGAKSSRLRCKLESLEFAVILVCELARGKIIGGKFRSRR